MCICIYLYIYVKRFLSLYLCEYIFEIFRICFYMCASYKYTYMYPLDRRHIILQIGRYIGRHACIYIRCVWARVQAGGL